jgi:hypothetical protein
MGKLLLLGLLCLGMFLPSVSMAAVYTQYVTEDTYTKHSGGNDNNNYGNQTTMWALSNTDAALLKIPLPDLDTSEIVAAEFRVSFWINGGNNLVLRPLLVEWDEMQVTHNSRLTGIPWDTPGARGENIDYSDACELYFGSSNTWRVVDATDFVKCAIDEGFLTNGFVIHILNEPQTGYDYYNTRETEGDDYRARIIIQTGTPGETSTFYVRPDGGTCGLTMQCTGLTNEDYPGSGSDQDCACALPTQAVSLMNGDDTVIIANGNYTITSMADVPGGSPGGSTKFYGEGWENCTDPSAVTIYGQGVDGVLRLNGHTDVRCMRLTDAIDCVTSQPGDLPACEVGGTMAGIRMTTGTGNYILNDVDILGTRHYGIYAARINDIDSTNLRIIGSGYVGWDSDVHGVEDVDYTGYFNMDGLVVAWSGCSMKYPIVNEENLLAPENFQYCMSQPQGGFGDGIGFGGRSGHWRISNADISFNASDGADWLYDFGGTGTIHITRSRFEGNAGNAIKTRGSLVLENSIVMGNCNFFWNAPFTTTAPQHRPQLGYLYLTDGGSQLTGTGIERTGIVLGTGNGSTTAFSGTLDKFPMKGGTIEVHYTTSGTPRTAAVSGPIAGGGGSISGTHISGGFWHYINGTWNINFTVAPDNETDITIDYVYNDVTPIGNYDGDRSVTYSPAWEVKITGEGTGTGGVDEWAWRKRTADVWGDWSEDFDVTTDEINLGDEARFTFKELTGHTENDVYLFTITGAWFSTCRALGDTIAIANYDAGNTFDLTNNTIFSVGNVLLAVSGDACDETTTINAHNNIFFGGFSFFDDGDIQPGGGFRRVDWNYATGTPGNESGPCWARDFTLNASDNLFIRTKYASTLDCERSTNSICRNDAWWDANKPGGFTGVIKQGSYMVGSEPGEGYYNDDDYYQQVYIANTSDAYDSANTGVTFLYGSEDFNNFPRTTTFSMGALEFGSEPTDPPDPPPDPDPPSGTMSIFGGTWYF